MTYIIDRNQHLGIALVSDAGLANPRYVPLDQSPQDWLQVAGVYLRQCHTVAAIVHARAFQGLYVGSFKKFDLEPGWEAKP